MGMSPRGGTDASLLAFCRAAVGQGPELWVVDAKGGGQRPLTRGHHRLGVDHPLWLG